MLPVLLLLVISAADQTQQRRVAALHSRTALNELNHVKSSAMEEINYS